MNADLIGYFAACLTTLCFVPQAIRVVKTKSAEGMSIGMYVTFTIGVGLWLVYGIVLGSKPIIASNCVTILLSGFILFRLIQLKKSSRK